MSGAEAAFGLISIAVVVGSVGAVASRQVVHAAWWLVLSLAALAGLYVVLGAEIVALVQLLVYVGAVVVLVLFALMLTRAPLGPRDDLDVSPRRRALAALVGLATTGAVAALLLSTIGGVEARPDPDAGEAATIGVSIFTGWVLPFELLSVLLLAALVGAVAVAAPLRRSGRRHDAGTPDAASPADAAGPSGVTQ